MIFILYLIPWILMGVYKFAELGGLTSLFIYITLGTVISVGFMLNHILNELKKMNKNK